MVKVGTPAKARDVVGMNLSGFEQPSPGKVAIDMRCGLISFATGEEPQKLSVNYTYGFSADMGGGPYERRQEMVDYEAVASERLLEASEVTAMDMTNMEGSHER